ncbi:Baculoviral IAP repeat-containing protein 6 [Dinochytrium kinnereticum]|nr:Baculoviral IAP repeat-containing protein 6 [Dinochytrium kinnereticum]
MSSSTARKRSGEDADLLDVFSDNGFDQDMHIALLLQAQFDAEFVKRRKIEEEDATLALKLLEQDEEFATEAQSVKTTMEGILTQAFGSPSCKKCHRPLAAGRFRVIDAVAKYTIESLPGMMILKCSQCQAKTCAACSAQITDDDMANHCTQVRLALVYAVLIRLQESHMDSKKENDRRHSKYKKVDHTHKARMTETKSDEKTMELLKSLRDLLPNASSDLVVDLLPHPDLLPMIWLSSFMPLMESYLRNDSLMDVMDRKDLYLEILEVLKALASHEVTLPLLRGRKKEKKSSSSSYSIPTRSSNVGDADDGPKLLDLLARLVRQSDVFVKTTGFESSEELGVQEVETIGVALEIKRTAEEVGRIYERNCGVPSAGSAKTDEVFANPEASYAQCLRGLTYKTLDALPLLCAKKLSKYQQQHISQAAPERRTLRIAKEIATLVTSLPCGPDGSIFIRAIEDDINRLRALMSGPPGTPYSQGLFEFDIYLGPYYPDQPPIVTFLTTGGGTVRFNPNLYSCGKVCLSLLGTWHGPGWVAGKSTLFQVLLSIQSLILVEHPYRNEPGYENSAVDFSPLEQYSKDVRRSTARWAILEMIRKPPKGFEDVVHRHFRMLKESILNTLGKWQQLDPTWNGDIGYALKLAGSRIPNESAWTRLSGEIKGEILKLSPCPGCQV